jgi:IPT/TIG domain
MTRQIRRSIVVSIILTVAIMMIIPQVPPVKALSGLSVDGTGVACVATVGSAVNLQSKTCPNGGPSVQLCTTQAGGVCPLSEGPFLVILQFLLNNTESITSVISNQGLGAFTRRGSPVLNGLGGEMEEWYSTDNTAALSNPSIGVGLSGSANITVAVQEFAITGYDQNTPFDLNTASPSSSSGSSNIMSTAISTDDPQDMLLGFSLGGTDGTIAAGAGFTGICVNAYPCAGNTVFKGVSPTASEYKIVTAPQADTAVSFTQTGSSSWAVLADAIRSASPGITLVSPSKGIIGTGITITGASFTGTLSLTFCTTLQPVFVVVNDTTITTTAPAIPSPPLSQTCDILVTKSSGSSTASPAGRFSFLPNVRSVTPLSGSNGTAVTITGTSFVGTMAVSLCGVSQPKFTAAGDTQIKFNVSNLAVTTSQPCDVVVTNSVGKSSTSGNDLFTYTPQGGSGGTAHVPNTPANSTRILYIITAGIAAAALFAVAGLMRRWDPRKKEQSYAPSQEQPASNPPLPAREEKIAQNKP